MKVMSAGPACKTHDVAKQVTTGRCQAVNFAPRIARIKLANQQASINHARQATRQDAAANTQYMAYLVKVVTAQQDTRDDE